VLQLAAAQQSHELHGAEARSLLQIVTVAGDSTDDRKFRKVTFSHFQKLQFSCAMF